MCEVIIATVWTTGGEVTRVRRLDRWKVDLRFVRRIVQVALAKNVADTDQHGESQRQGHAMPAEGLIERLHRAVEEIPGQRLPISLCTTHLPDSGHSSRACQKRHA